MRRERIESCRAARAFYRLKTCDLCDRVPGAALNSGRARAIVPLLS